MNMQAVAAAIEEFSASIGEIASQTNRVASYATEAVTTVEKTSLIAMPLARRCRQAHWVSVVEMISDIANQTTRPLTPPLEAARAGEAGKGLWRRKLNPRNANRQVDRGNYHPDQRCSECCQSGERGHSRY